MPLRNICRLPKEEAFSFAYQMEKDNPETTAFYRFADFENYYPRRMKQDEYLYNLFVSLGGTPKEKHPLSFVLQGSDYLENWFGNGLVSRIKLQDIPSEFISFTFGDSMASFEKNGECIMYTKEMLQKEINRYSGTTDDYIKEIAAKYYYIEAQLWNDQYCVV